ncbi:MAG: VWA domain-containing protein [Myxococcales bacterium]|nr:VWA domain-containing protein [Myxococcales bacterium]
MRGPEDAANDDAAGAAPEPAEPEAPMREERARRTMKKSGRSMPKPSPAPPPIADETPRSDDASGEGYEKVEENQFLKAGDEPLSTFSIDVDTASYSNMRRFVTQGRVPPADAVRVEEFVNYFNYDYPEPEGLDPFSISTEVAPCPWAPGHTIAQIGIKGRSIGMDQLPARNLVFLLDVSGSMNDADKLPLLKRGLGMLARELRPQDSVAIVVYAGASGLVLPATPGSQRSKIIDALEQLSAGGSTNGGQGIELAYTIAQSSFKKDGINRVILATDGDFNVGTRDRAALERLIEEKRKTGVFLTVLGFGRGNLKDSTMEMLADKGNGNYAYIDSVREAEKVLVREAGATLATIAKDVKIQVEFNPRLVSEYRLIGYENRMLAAQDFNDDTKDAGEIGAGRTVTALYELIPPGGASAAGTVDALKYQNKPTTTAAANSGELMTVKVRYKQPDGDKSTLLTRTVEDDDRGLEGSSDNLRLAAGVASFAMLLKESKLSGDASLDSARKLVNGAIGQDPHGDRRELLTLIDKVSALGLKSRAATRTAGDPLAGF